MEAKWYSQICIPKKQNDIMICVVTLQRKQLGDQ